jgi:hypothetical protein
MSYSGRTYAEGKKNRLERWFPGFLLHYQIQPVAVRESAFNFGLFYIVNRDSNGQKKKN